MDTNTVSQNLPHDKEKESLKDRPSLAWCSPNWNQISWRENEKNTPEWMDDSLYQSANWHVISPETELIIAGTRKTLRIILNIQDNSTRLITCRCPDNKKMSDQQSLQMIVSRLPQIDGLIWDVDIPALKSSLTLGSLQPVPQNGQLNGSSKQISHTEIPFIAESSLSQQHLRSHFFTRVFAFNRIKKLPAETAEIQGFHSKYKLLLMAHNQVAYKLLGQIASNTEKRSADKVLQEYRARFLETLSQTTTIPKKTNVLEHIRGYFKKQVSPSENSYLQGVISRYRKGNLPFTAVTTVFDYVSRQFNDLYMQDQYFLNPYPEEFNPSNRS